MGFFERLKRTPKEEMTPKEEPPQMKAWEELRDKIKVRTEQWEGNLQVDINEVPKGSHSMEGAHVLAFYIPGEKVKEAESFLNNEGYTLDTEEGYGTGEEGTMFAQPGGFKRVPVGGEYLMRVTLKESA